MTMKTASRRSAVIAVCGLVLVLAGSAWGQGFSWQRPHAKVLPTGDLRWQPEPFAFEAGPAVRYIDYEAGDDANPGTRERPWRHHPWDAAATGRAAEAAGPITYVFKRGVIYRGQLVADESGTAEEPIRLTSDPDWGEGEAMLFGSVRLAGGWTRCGPDDVPEGMPEPREVWYRDIGTEHTPHALWRWDGGEATRIHIAREPDWTITNPDDPQSNWWTWTGRERGVGSIDTEHLTQQSPDFYDGGYVWTEWTGNMGTIHLSPIESYDPEAHALRGPGINGRRGNRYFIENIAVFLDSPGEYFHATEGEHAGRLYVRLPDGADPNDAVLEASRRVRLIDIVDQRHIEISGLRFSFNDVGEPTTGWPPVTKAPTAIRIAGHCRDITVRHCRFLHVMSVLNAHPRMNEQYSNIYLKDLSPWRADVMDQIAFTDNEAAYVDRPAVQFAHGRMLGRIERPPYGQLKRIEALRNRFYHIGMRPGSREFSAIPTLAAYFPEEAEIAGNILDRCWGAGLFIFGGKPSNEIGSTPFTRILLHHNKVTNTMLACNDYGGIEYWQGGPIYAFNNISGNAIGYRHYADLANDWKTVAYNMYLDGTFKSYTFNNIIWGKSNDKSYPYRNRGAYFVVLGSMNHFFNNTIYQFRHGIVGSSGNRSSFLGNLITGISGDYIQQNRKGDTSLRGGGDTGETGVRGMPTNAYANNVFAGERPIGNAGPVRGNQIEQWRQRLEELGAQAAQVGWRVDGNPLADPEAHNFAVRDRAAVEDRGVRFFVPWALYGVVGEWHFVGNPADPTTVLGENFYMSEELIERHDYDLAFRNDLTVPEAKLERFVRGELESWTDRGALRFDGASQHGVLTHEAMTQDVTLRHYAPEDGDRVESGEYVFPGEQRPTVDMADNSFVVEAYLRTEPGLEDGTIAAKSDGTTGYRLIVDGHGAATLQLEHPTLRSPVVVRGTPINDGRWRHVLAEVDRAAGVGRVYVDGELTGEASIAPLAGASLSNEADFYVGRGPDGRYFAGAIDFLRVARGSLAEARTTIEELHAWQFDGPQHRDFAGRRPTGDQRDAGALEAVEQ